MTVCITKNCTVKNNDRTVELKTGDFITLPDDKAAKLVKAEHARDIVANDYRAVVAEFVKKDPQGGCWAWVVSTLPEVWKRHIESMRSGDLAEAVSNFNEMVTAWHNKMATSQEV